MKNYQLKNEDELLDAGVRKKIIQAINGQENLRRKDQAYKAYQCYKDQTSRYVREQLIRQFDEDTVNESQYAVSNVSFLRKVVDKLARVYKYGVDRELWEDDKQLEDATETLKKIIDETDADRKFKKCNRYFKLFKNTLMYIRPKPVSEDKQTIKIDPLPPYLYDAVEMQDEREKAMAYVLSNYTPRDHVSGNVITPTKAVVPGTTGRDGNYLDSQIYKGDGIDQPIADTPGDEAGDQYVFWSTSYHFTCNSSGEIVSGEDIENPIEEIPAVNYAEDQDGSFWAIGGDDLVDGNVLVNSLITNINHIAISQGYGQLVVTGSNLPRQMKTGPNKAVLLEQQEGDPTPSFEFKNASAPLDQLRSLVEMYVALLLTTNNLSTSGVQSNLQGGMAFPSGIAMMIDKAESMEDVEDQRQIFIDNEPHVWRVYAKWHELLKNKGELPEELAAVDMPSDFDLRVKFGQPKAIESEKERLDVLKIKKELGLISAVDMIKAEHPSLSDAEAEDKLKSILEEKMARMAGIVSGKQDADGILGTEQTQDDEAIDVGDQPELGQVEKAQDSALNGAQVSSMVEVVQSVASGELPRSSAVEIIKRAFLVSAEEADNLIGDAGKGFTPSSQGGSEENESNREQDEQLRDERNDRSGEEESEPAGEE